MRSLRADGGSIRPARAGCGKAFDEVRPAPDTCGRSVWPRAVVIAVGVVVDVVVAADVVVATRREARSLFDGGAVGATGVLALLLDGLLADRFRLGDRRRDR